jgi:drug/metabolite transporter (DMT)-like permease
MPSRTDRPAAARATHGPPVVRLVAAFGAIYVIWGSTYLAIRFAIETMPPFTMAGLRFLVAGVLLLGWARVRGVPAPTRAQLRDGAVVGALLLLGGNGAVVWAEQWVPSGLVALLVATVPLFMVLLDWLWGGAVRPGLGLWAGLIWGLIGVAFLVGGEEMGGGGGRQLAGGLVVLFGALSWATGSIYSRTARLPAAPRMATSLQMLWGGTFLLAAGALLGEWSRWDPGATTLRSWLALSYLIVFGSLVAFAAYVWLLTVTTAARVSTYAYVNPVVALLLGWALADERLTDRTGVAAAIILSAVVMLNVLGARRRRSRG